MKFIEQKLLSLILAFIFLLRPTAFAADTTIASFNVSGTVPTFFSATARGLPGDLDLTPNVVVNNRRLGLIHFKYNANVASLTISSNTPSGGPEGTGGAYDFQGGGFKISVAAGCATVDPAYNAPFVLTAAGTDVKSVASTALVTGVEEDCDLFASWRGTNRSLPLAGVYSLNISVTMISQ
ncbi:MAG: hypothetical protein ACXWRE_01710 [Pseudobdellovibrionaceae bacterium]